jgi:guanylate kinase
MCTVVDNLYVLRILLSVWFTVGVGIVLDMHCVYAESVNSSCQCVAFVFLQCLKVNEIEVRR